MTIGGAIRRCSPAGIAGTGLVAAVAALAISLAAYAQSTGTLDLPEQIGQPHEGSVAIENLAPPATARNTDSIIDPISTGIDPQPGIIVQPQGGRDLCGPGVSAWERQQAGVDCRGIDGGKTAVPAGRTGASTAIDPLQSSGVNEVFDSLGVGAEIPSTTILQRAEDGEEIVIVPVIQGTGQVTNDLLVEPEEATGKEEEMLDSLGLGADVPATVILQK